VTYRRGILLRLANWVASHPPLVWLLRWWNKGGGIGQ
jgi:hypothetical protein